MFGIGYRKHYWEVVLVGGLIAACLFFLLQWKRANVKLEELKAVGLSYQNPKKAKNTVTRTERGPERTVYRMISLDKMEETVIERGEVVVIEGVNETSEPIAIAKISPPTRTDRWLLSIGGNRFSKDFEGKAILVGYGFRNRFDLQAGLVRTDETRPWLLATVRF